MHPIAFRREGGAERGAARDDAVECRPFRAKRAGHRFIGGVVAHETEMRRRYPGQPDLDPRHHADPIAVLPAAMAGMEREAAEAVEDRLAAIKLDRQRIMRPVADHDV